MLCFRAAGRTLIYAAAAPICLADIDPDDVQDVTEAMTTKTAGGARCGRGRPRTFDRERSLQAAMKLFWERGYEGASFDDLIAAMSISPSSFYNTFGSKEQLYREATECYVNGPGSWFACILSETTETRTAFERLIRVAADRLTSKDFPCGCMISL